MKNFRLAQSRKDLALHNARILTGHTIARVAEAAAILGVTSKHLHTLAKSVDFPEKIQIGDHAVGWRVIDLEKWIDSRCEPAKVQSGGEDNAS